MDSTSIAAWWGATLATGVFVWEMYKWVAYRVRIEVRAKAGMKLLVQAASPEDATLAKPDDTSWVTITVSNQGELPTTLEQISLSYCRNLWQRIWHKAEASFVVLTLGQMTGGSPLPRVLGPGETWTDVVKETSEISQLLEQGRLYCFAHCSTSKHPPVCRVTKSCVEPTTGEGDSEKSPSDSEGDKAQ